MTNDLTPWEITKFKVYLARMEKEISELLLQDWTKEIVHHTIGILLADLSFEQDRIGQEMSDKFDERREFSHVVADEQ